MLTVIFKQNFSLSYDGVNSWQYVSGKPYTARNAYENNYFQHMIGKGIADPVVEGEAKQTKVTPAPESKVQESKKPRRKKAVKAKQ